MKDEYDFSNGVRGAVVDSDIYHDDDSPATTEADWNEAFVCHSATELQAEMRRRVRDKSKLMVRHSKRDDS